MRREASDALGLTVRVPPSRRASAPAWLVVGFAALGLLACDPAPPAGGDGGSSSLELARCDGGGSLIEAKCGMLSVPERRSAGNPDGRTIDLRVMVLPARGRNPAPDPLFVLAGGPGQAATEVGPLMLGALRDVHLERDIVLVDQRGTGRSNPLDCDDPDEDTLAAMFRTDVVVEDIDACLASLDADPREYATPQAMDDLDAVREALGYEQINLFGISYGTRAALVYMRRHPEHVRAVILDGAAPVEIQLPLHMAEDGAGAMERLFEDCEAESNCAGAFPDLRHHHRALLERLEDQPHPVALDHPRTGKVEEVLLTREAVVAILRGALYSGELSSLIPLAIERAYLGDFQQLAAMAVAASATGETLSQGMFLSVVCTEDIPQIDEAALRAHAGSSAPKSGALASVRAACERWPRGQLPEGYADPVVSAAPTVIFSGQNDPATPPRWGDRVAETLGNSRHLVVPGIGHGAWAHGCTGELMAQFLSSGDPSTLDSTCLERIRRPRFFVSAAGPRPAMESSASTARRQARSATPANAGPTEGEMGESGQ